MKQIRTVVLLLILCGCCGAAEAQTRSQTPTHKTHNPTHHQVHQRVRQTIRQIEKDEKSGKITHQQAMARKAKLKSIHDQQKAFTQQNHGGDLTSSQAAQLNQSLDGINSK